MAADANAPVEPLDQDLDRIIAELDAPFGHLPAEAIRAAQSNRDRIIPRLMQSLDGVVQTIQPDEKGKTNGAFFALFLLIEFRAAEAFDTIVRAVSLPGDLPSRLFGDALHEVLPLAVPAMANDRLDDVLALIRNRKLDEFVRWAFVEGLVRLVCAEVRSRDEIVTILRQLLTEAIENKDIGVITPVINSLIDLYPEEAYDEIKRAYDVGLADELMLSFEDVERRNETFESWRFFRISCVRQPGVPHNIHPRSESPSVGNRCRASTIHMESGLAESDSRSLLLVRTEARGRRAVG